MIRLGVAGTGGLGEALIADAMRMPDMRVVAVQDADLTRVREVADRYAIARVASQFDELVHADNLDAVAICTPNGMHAEQAQATLRAGKHALVQKPLALTEASARDTIDVATKAGRVLFVDYTYRFLETMQALRTAIDRPVRSVQARFDNIYGPGAHKTWFFDPRRSGGGALIDLGVHLLDLCLWLLEPDTVRLVSAELGNEGPVEQVANLELECDDVTVRLDVSWNAQLPETLIGLELTLVDGTRVVWQNVAGSFYDFRSLRDNQLLIARQTSLRADTLRCFNAAVASGCAPSIDTRVYRLLDQAYGRAG